MTACTITKATGTCGKPSVTSFVTRGGETLYECADHAYRMGAAEGEAAVGGLATVRVHGVTKTGRIVGVTPTFLRVEVATYGGKAARTVTVRRGEAIVL